MPSYGAPAYPKNWVIHINSHYLRFLSQGNWISFFYFYLWSPSFDVLLKKKAPIGLSSNQNKLCGITDMNKYIGGTRGIVYSWELHLLLGEKIRHQVSPAPGKIFPLLFSTSCCVVSVYCILLPQVLQFSSLRLILYQPQLLLQTLDCHSITLFMSICS